MYSLLSYCEMIVNEAISYIDVGMFTLHHIDRYRNEVVFEYSLSFGRLTSIYK